MIEQNKEVIRRWIVAFNERDWATLRSFWIADSYVYRGFGVELHGAENWEQFIRSFLAGFPDLQCTIEDLFGEGDRCAWRLRFRGTHTGNFMGTAATGKQIEMVTTGISRLENGKVAEDWEEGNMLGLLQQIGAVPAAASAG
jgi:predicted ester cyclase